MCKAELAAALTKEIGETSSEVSEREVDLIFEVRSFNRSAEDNFWMHAEV